MSAGDLTAGAGCICENVAAIKTTIDALNLAAVTDFIKIVPTGTGGWIIFKVEREADA